MKKYILLAITTLISMSMWAYEDPIDITIDKVPYKLYKASATPGEENYAEIYLNSTAETFAPDTKVTIPSSVKDANEISYTVTKLQYWKNSAKVKLELPNTVTTITWANLSALQELTIPTTFTSLNLGSIRSRIDILKLPATLASLNIYTGTDDSFGQRNIAAFEVATDNENYKSVDGVVFSKDGKTLFCYPYLKDGASYTMPEGVEIIAQYAFYYNSHIETIALPSTLKTISQYSFSGCSNLYNCVLPVSLVTIGREAFKDCSILSNIGIFSNLANLKTIDRQAFWNCHITSENNEIQLPGNLKTIGYQSLNKTFYPTDGFTVILPYSLGTQGSSVEIDFEAFNNSVIKSYMMNPMPATNSNAFRYVGKIYIPKGKIGEYKTKQGWNYDSGNKLYESVELLPEDQRAGIPQFVFNEKDSTVTITASPADAIYYSTNGEEPEKVNANKYDASKPISAKENITIIAIAVKEGRIDANATYVVDRYVLDAVTVEPYVKSTDGNEVIFVKMSTSQADAKIYYLKNSNSSTPAKSSIVSEYKESDPPSVVNNNYIHAYAVKDGYSETGITNFQIKTADITCKQPTYEYNTKEDGSVVLTFNTTTEGATIYYETYDVNGSNLLVASKAYPSTGIVVDGNYTFKAKAVKDKMLSSSVTSTVSTSHKTFSATTPNVKIVASYNDLGEEVMKAVITSGSTDEAVKAKETFAYRIGTSGDVNSPYSAPVTVNDGERFYAVAKVDNWQTSSSWVNPYDTYNYIYKSHIRCAAPTQTSDRDNHKVILSTTTDGADIYYTLDGTEPTLEDAKYNPETGVILKNNAKLRAMAVKADMFNSSTSEVEYNNWFTCPNVTIEQIFVDGTPKMRLSLADSTSVDVTGIQIYYKVNDWWTYADGWMEYGETYNDQPVYVDYGNTIYAVAIKDGFTMSGRSSKSVDYSSYTRCALPTCDFDDDNRKVILSTTEENGKIYYTVDGSIPTTASTLYTEPISSTKRCEIKAITARDPETVDEVTTVYANSDIVTISLDEWFRFDRVKFHPVLGTAENEYKMALTAEEGTIIEYGINNYGGTIYTDTFAVEAGQYVYAIARSLTTDSIDSDWSEYYISKNSYTVSQPYVNVNSETHTMTVTCDTDGADIYYTSDGTDPTTESTKLTQSNIEVSLNGDYRFIAAKEGMHTSAISKISINWFRVPNVDIIPVVEDNVLKVKLECADPDASIYWGYSGDYESQTVTANTLYTGSPFAIEDGANIYASAVKSGFTDAYWTNSGWIYKSSYTSTTPSITVAADTTVTISSTAENVTYYYTLNGEDPTTASSKFTSKFKLSSNATIKAIAVEEGKLYSSVNTREYTGFRVSSVVITPKVIDNKLKVVLETPTPGAKIYYAINENNPTTTLNMNYTEPFEINNGDYIYANAVKEGYSEAGWSTHSWIYYSEYTCSQPTITVKADTTVVISANEGATIYYTLDGTEPTTSSTKYTSEFKLKKNGTIKAIAVEAGKMSSNVREREYSGFYVKNINFALDGIKMTLTSETPDVTFNYCYETDPREDVTGNLVYSRTYSGPFNMEYNGYIYVRATKDGYNTTESSYWVPNLVKWAKPDTLSFDGHKLKFKEIAGAQIWYTTNGDYPEANYRGTLYKDSILVSNTGVIRAIAVGDYKNQSDIAEIEIKSFASESGAVSEKAGGLATAMAWKGDLETITDYTVTGPINSDDIEFIKDKMTSLQKLDLSGATADGGIIPDNAFAGLPLVMFSSPNALQSVGKNIFTGCKDLAAVVWNTTTKIPNDAFDKDVNPNLLLFVPAEDAAPTSSSARNIIVNNTAENIYLSDGEDNNFYSPKRFYTKNITYTHDFKLTTGSASGWETICLPFDCAYFVHESKGELKPFAEYNELSDKGSYKPFWLRELTDIGFQDARMIEANKPYIISMPNNEGYATRFRVGGKVTFSASNVYVPETVQGSAQKGDVTLYANFMNSSETSDMLLLNTEASDDHEAGSIFVLNSGRAVRPFEAYVISSARSRAYISVRGLGGDDDDDATAITERTIEDSDMVKVYNLSGVLVKQSTKEDALKGLAKGVYIVNGKRMIVK